MNFFKMDVKSCQRKVDDTFKKLDKNTLIQEARYFNSTIIDSRKCKQILTKILYLLYQGENLSLQETTNMFFSITKLFKFDAILLRQLIYLSLKELSLKSNDVIILTSTLTRDLSGKVDKLRAAAIRAISSIIDPDMLHNVERYVQLAIIDKNPAVSSAALVSVLHQSDAVPDLVQRWVNVAQEAIMSDNNMVSYHALGVVTKVRANNRLSIMKVVSRMSSTPIQSTYTLHLVIRHAALLVMDDSKLHARFFKFIESCLQHKDKIVVYEALHAYIHLCKSPKKIAPLMPYLKIFCSSSKATVRLAGVRSLVSISSRHPHVVKKTNIIDFERLLSDSNNWVATMAIVTVLSVGTPSSIKHLMNPLPSFLANLPDECKIVVVNTIKRLYSKYPQKYSSILLSLGELLLVEGSEKYKGAVIEAMIPMFEGKVHHIMNIGLTQMCEFLEICEYNLLAVRVLDIVSRESSKSRQPSNVLRYIYNRILLDSPQVRAAAVRALAILGATRSEVLPSVKVLLTRCLCDDDDEVRDRAVIYKSILDSENPNLIDHYITDVQILNVFTLEGALFSHLRNQSNEPFDISKIPTEKKLDTDEMFNQIDFCSVAASVVSASEPHCDIKERAFPDMNKYGDIFRSFDPVDLTEYGADYRIRCIIHVFERNLLLEFECINTLPNKTLENVRMKFRKMPGYIKIAETTCDEIIYDNKENILLLFEFPNHPDQTLVTFSAALEFTVRELTLQFDVENNTVSNSVERYKDECFLQDLAITRRCQFRMNDNIENWQEHWENASDEVEVHETFSLLYTNIEDAAKAIIKHLELPNNVYYYNVEGHVTGEIRGGGIWREKVPVLMKINLELKRTILTVSMHVRSPRYDIASFVFIDLVPDAFVIN